jgi:hypothetical protein
VRASHFHMNAPRWIRIKNHLWESDFFLSAVVFLPRIPLEHGPRICGGISAFGRFVILTGLSSRAFHPGRIGETANNVSRVALGKVREQVGPRKALELASAATVPERSPTSPPAALQSFMLKNVPRQPPRWPPRGKHQPDLRRRPLRRAGRRERERKDDVGSNKLLAGSMPTVAVSILATGLWCSALTSERHHISVCTMRNPETSERSPRGLVVTVLAALFHSPNRSQATSGLRPIPTESGLSREARSAPVTDQTADIRVRQVCANPEVTATKYLRLAQSIGIARTAALRSYVMIISKYFMKSVTFNDTTHAPWSAGFRSY